MRSSKQIDNPEAVESTPTPDDDARTETPVGMTRRKALSTGVGAVAAVALAGCQTTGQTPVKPVPTSGGLVPGSKRSARIEKIRDAQVPKNFSPNFSQPNVLRSGRDKAIRQNLVVRKADLQILQPDPKKAGEWDYRSVTTRTYNGQVPGPTMEVYPGDKLEFTLHNQLDNEEPTLPEPYGSMTCAELMALDIPHCFNTTNLHTHGLHVSPSSRNGVASDDISIKIEPGASQDYCIWLPEFHAPGTHWYHAHVHGSTALQVADGAAGALIVKEPNPAAEIPVDNDLVWLIQEIVGEPSDSVYAAIVTAPDQPLPGTALYGTAPPNPHFTVNAQNLAELTMTTAQIHRWRLINGTGTPRGFMNVVLEKDDGAGGRQPYTGTNKGLNLMAVDGITFYGEPAVPVPAGGHYMSPGNRADFLVQISEPGTYYVVKKKAVIQTGGGTALTADQDLVRVVVTGSTLSPRALPSLPGIEHRPCYLTPIEDNEVTEQERLIHFSVIQAGVFGGFTINRQAYGENPATIDVDYHAVEEWKLTNDSGAAHPFHIHVNPFQVVGELINPNKPNVPSNWRWQDVISVPPNETAGMGEVRIRQRFLTYSGGFVIHCHVLIHEDCGMMRNVAVGAGGADACEPVEVCNLP